jgi:hypothetical protein
MHRLRFAILGAVGALALGTASAVAMQESAGGGTDPDQHGSAVASAARTCPHGPNGVHGQCVSAIASAEGQENRDSDNSNVSACKAADATEDKTETQPAKHDKAAKAADKTEDKAEHKAFAACVSGGASESETSDTTEPSDTTAK